MRSLGFCLGGWDRVKGRGRRQERRLVAACSSVSASGLDRGQAVAGSAEEVGGLGRGLFQGDLLLVRESGVGGVERTYNSESARRFLENYWQKKPVLFRRALDSFSSPLSPDELAGLACEQDVESRLVIHWQGIFPAKDQRIRDRRPDYELRLGPFSDSDFQKLPERSYTLLVQEVNAHIQEVSDLLDHFRFLPNWRLDDVMVSYATEGGGVGPHVDSYDVFLLQAEGRRKWSISYTPIFPEQEKLIENSDVRVLADNFVIDEEWILEPGDMLYVPPRIPHWGVSLDDKCMTFSIGMRAPEKKELLRSFTDYLITNRIPGQHGFVEDNADDLCKHNVGTPAANGEGNPDPGLLSAEAVLQARNAVREILDLDDQEFSRWYARFVTLPKRNYMGASDESMMERVSSSEAAGILAEIASGAGVSLRHREAMVFSYLSASTAGTPGDVLYINGESFPLHEDSKGTAKLLCSRKVLQGCSLQQQLVSDPNLEKLLSQLICRGLLYCVYDDEP